MKLGLKLSILYAKCRKFFGVKKTTLPLSNVKIEDILKQNTAVVIGRTGTVELRTWIAFLFGGQNEQLKMSTLITTNAGFFQNDFKSIYDYSYYMLNIISKVDYLCPMVVSGENYIFRKYASQAKYLPLSEIDPCINPWTTCLQGKKVLVVHPMDELIKEQYKNRKYIFPDGRLPDFELHTIKAVQTIANNEDERFQTWFEALEWMYQECLKESCDIVLIGCGSYGLPLATRLKESGKKAVHMGGCLQLLFGIRGERWDNRPYMQKFYNEYWVRPGENDRPQGLDKVENGCYW